MYDPDPRPCVLHLDAPRKASQPTALTDRQHLVRIAQAEADAAYIAFTGGNGSPVCIVSILRKADAELSRCIDAL